MLDHLVDLAEFFLARSRDVLEPGGVALVVTRHDASALARGVRGPTIPIRLGNMALVARS